MCSTVTNVPQKIRMQGGSRGLVLGNGGLGLHDSFMSDGVDLEQEVIPSQPEFSKPLVKPVAHNTTPRKPAPRRLGSLGPAPNAEGPTTSSLTPQCSSSPQKGVSCKVPYPALA